MSAITISMGTDRPLISSQSVSKRLVEVTVTAAAASAGSESGGIPAPPSEFVSEAIRSIRNSSSTGGNRRRLPLNLALVIDRSGSMSEARKLDYVKQAALHVLSVLTEQDRVALIAYDNQVQVLSPGVAVTPSARQRLSDAVRALQPGGSTALFDGWLRGADEAARNLSAGGVGGVNRVLLLTDGLANVGETRQQVLEGHAGQLAARGVSTSTFGVGADFNQFLLEGMARHGGGTYHFIEHPNQIPSLFATELSELLSVIVRDAELRIIAPESGGASLTLFGELNHAKEGAYRLRIPLGTLYAGQERLFFLEALTPPRPAAAVLDPSAVDLSSVVLRAEVSGVDMDGYPVREATELTLRYATDAEVNAAPRDEALTQRSAKVQMAQAETEALRLAEAGQSKDAAKRLRTEAQKLAQVLPAPAFAEAQEVADKMEQEALSPMQRKQRHDTAYRTQTSRDRE